MRVLCDADIALSHRIRLAEYLKEVTCKTNFEFVILKNTKILILQGFIGKNSFTSEKIFVAKVVRFN